MRKIIGVDGRYAHIVARNAGLQHFPYRAFRNLVAGEADQVLEMFATVHRPPMASDDPEEIARQTMQATRLTHALQDQGCTVLQAQSKHTRNGADGRPGVKSVDDQVLMIRLAITCMRLRPDFLVLVTADGDFHPLVAGLREDGIRTEIVADHDSLASDLRRVAYAHIDAAELLRDPALQPAADLAA